MPTILQDWDITAEYLTAVVRDNPSLRGMILGYLAERKLRDVFEADPRVSELYKDDDHDRRRKGDLVCTYRGRRFVIEVKSLQTNNIRMEQGGTWVERALREHGSTILNPRYEAAWPAHRDRARFEEIVQCDASDRRTIALPTATG